MQADTRVRREERLHLFGLMGRQIIENDVDLPSRGLRRDHRREELDEVRTGVPRSRLADDRARPRVECRIQRSVPCR